MIKELTFNLGVDNDIVSNNLETSVITEGLKSVTGGYMTDLRPGGVCNNFTLKAVTVLKALGCYGNIYWLQQVQYQGISESIYLLNILNTPQTYTLFELFKKLGINISNLKIGCDTKFNKIYITNKLLRDLSKYGTDTITQIGMYLISLVYLFVNLTIHPVSLNYEPALDTVTVNNEFFSNIKQYLYNFKEHQDVVFTEMLVEDVEKVVFFQTAYSRVNSHCTSYPGTFALLRYTNSESEVRTGILYNYGAKAINPNFIRIQKNGESDTVVIVNTILNIMDLDNDSLYSLIANNADGNVYISYNKSLSLKPELSYSILGYDESECDESIKKIASAFINVGISESFNVTEASKSLGITLKSEGLCDVSSMEALYADDEYAQFLYKQKQDYYDSFDLKELSPVIKSFAKGDTYSMIFYGESGTGKSTAARVIPYRCGLPFISVNFSTNIEESDLIGTMIPNVSKKTVEDPEFIWQDGILTRAVRAGYTAILEEINFARPGILGKLNSLLDENRQIELPTGEIVKANKNFRMIATCNIAYEGTQRLNKAFINRFELVYEFKDLPREELINIIISRTGYSDRTKIEKIVNVYTAIKKYSKEQNIGVVVSLRQLLNLFRQGKYFKNAQIAVEAILINGAFIEDSDYKENFVDTVLKAFDLKFKI